MTTEWRAPSEDSVLVLLNRVDIFGLRRMGAPRDEYLPEAERIVDLVEERGPLSLYALDRLLEHPGAEKVSRLHRELTLLYERINPV
jgi:hypothetical protein